MAGTTLLLCATSATAQRSDFDHFATRFPLVGAHQRVDCESCHQNGVFFGTPTQCRLCHDGTGIRATTAPSARHIPHAGLDCDDCHRMQRWDQPRMDHTRLTNRCTECHNGVFATGLPARHIPAEDDCENCHRTTTWNRVSVDHDFVIGTCSSCHDGVLAEGKNRSHITTVEQCDVCHTTRRWSPTDFDHSGITDPCSTCHNGVTATGTPRNHFMTAAECDVCHSTRRWSSPDYDHAGTAYPGDHRRNLDCDDCHGGNSDTVTWRSPSYQPDCAACHAREYERDEHRKIDSPRIYYTVSELRDCSGSCHIYTDESETTIRRRRNSQHSVRDSEFDD